MDGRYQFSLYAFVRVNRLCTRLPRAWAGGSGRQLVSVRREMQLLVTPEIAVFICCVRPAALP